MRHFFEHQLVRYRRTYRGTIVSGLVLPVFFLASLGLGVGSMVDTTQLDDVSYLEFVGPALLATAAMQFAAGESLWATLGAIKWDGTYQALLATPLTSGQLAVGHVGWIALRVLFSSVLFTGVLVAFGTAGSALVMAAPLAAMLVAAAHAAPISAWSAGRETDATFPLILRLGVVPMFLFSGAFFPTDELPGVLPTLVTLVPIWHGVELCRDLASGVVDTGTVLHVAYPAAITVGGLVAFVGVLRSRLTA